MTALDRLIPHPRLREIDRIGVWAPPALVWPLARHGDLSGTRFTRALFALRSFADGSKPHGLAPTGLRIDDLRSSPERPGFQVLVDDPPHEVAVGAIGRVWHLRIPFVHVPNADAYAAFDEPGYVKVAWALRVCRQSDSAAVTELEVRVTATDEAAWRRFRRYFGFIGPWSRVIRRLALRALARRARRGAGASPIGASLPTADPRSQ
jgi:hypothetical protein